MNKLQTLVSKFNQAVKAKRSSTTGLTDTELRARLIEEEAREVAEAIRSGNLAHTLKELSDLLYVTFGACDVFGVDIDPYYEAVHNSNMSKIGAPRDANGKVTKGSNYKPPDIEGMLARGIGVELDYVDSFNPDAKPWTPRYYSVDCFVHNGKGWMGILPPICTCGR